MSFNMSSKFLLITFSSLTFVANVSNCELMIAQTKSPETPTVTRPRVTFFEQEQKFSKDDSPNFGNENFLQSALSGTTMAIEDPAKLSPNAVNSFSANLITSPTVVGLLKTGPLNSAQSSVNNVNFTPVGSISPTVFGTLTPSSNPQIGTITITSGTLNGQNVAGTYNYNAGYSRSGSTSSGTILLVNPNNPSQSLLIQAPPQPFSGSSNGINGPASISIGLPKDR